MSSVDDVKARLDIVDVIGGYVRLQKAGRYFKANCPFHNERTPSFVVYPERQSWHCFGACGTGGDVFAFIARKENLDFGSALRLLADRAGVELRSDGKRREELKTLYDANEAAALCFHSQLQHSGAARAYAEQRGLDRQTLNDFQVGYASPGWDGLREHLKGRGFQEAMLVEAGLLIQGDPSTGSGQARVWDRFRDRLMFPIRDERGRVVGFGGRIMPAGELPKGDPPPKYVNTPQTPIFDKGAMLYGLHRAAEEARSAGTVVVVEGYMDVVAAHQFGYRNVVASMGTALTERQASLLRRYAGRLVLAMDADEAGKAANLRAMQVVAASQTQIRGAGRDRQGPLEIRVLALPTGKDPDELIRTDAASWPVAVASARPVVDHLLTVTSAGLDLRQPQDRSRLVTEVLPVIGEVIDPVLQAHYLQRLSRLARVSEEALRRQMPRRARPSPTEAALRAGDGQAQPSAAVSIVPRRAAREEFCLALLHREPELSYLGQELPEELFALSENRELLRRWKAALPVSEDEGDLWEHLQAVLATRIAANEGAQAEEAFLDCVWRLEMDRMKSVKEASFLALAEEEPGVRAGDVAARARAMLAEGISEGAEGNDPAEAVALRFLNDNGAGLVLNRRLIEYSRSARAGLMALE